MVETLTGVEKLNSYPSIRIILQRHGETDRTRPKADDPKEVKDKAGWLTPEGVERTREVAREKGEEILAEGKPVTFFFLNSPTPWYGGEGLTYGKRAEHTAQVSAEEIERLIEEKGLNPAQAEIHQFRTANAQKKLHDTAIVQEPDLYFVWGSKHPTAYIDAMRKKYGSEWEEGFHKMEADLEEARKLAGAQSSEELGQSTMRIFKVIEQYARKYADIFSGRELVFWIDSHGDRIRSTLQYGIGAQQAAENHLFKENELLDLTLEDGVVSTSFQNQNYSKNINE